MLKVLWRSRMGAEQACALSNDKLQVTIETDIDKAKALMSDITTLVDGRPDSELLDGPKLQHVIVPYVGIHRDLHEAIVERPHLKLYNSHFNDRFVAQHTVALLMACANQLLPADRQMREGRWIPFTDDGLESFNLYGKSCLLVGYGAIGKEVARLLAGFGMTMSVLKRTPVSDSSLKVFTPSQLHAALSQADIVIISLPGTPETEGMFDQAAFKAMRKGSLLVNVGRGSVIDQQALFETLKTGHLKAAGIDVWWNYPDNREEQTYPADVPLHELPNLLMSPHRAAHYEKWQETSFEDVLKTLNALAAGEERNRVDTDRGY
jgi:phosphoglycerate dehydrogenase-like enzyme